MSTAPTGSVDETTHGGLVAATWNALSLFAFLGLCTLILLGVAYFGNGPMRAIGLSEDRAPIQIVIGNDVFAIPENTIRHGTQRSPGVTNSVDLVVHWPSAEGYSSERLAEFSSTDPSSIDTVLVGLTQRHSLLDMRSRFQPALKRALLGGSVTQLSSGLYEAKLDPQYGFIDETLVYSRAQVAGGDPQFVARCYGSTAQKKLLHPCELDSFIGVSGAARVRFSRTRLYDWRTFQVWLESALDGLLTKTD